MKNTWVTLLTGGDRYLPGVEVLGRSLDATGTRADKVVLVSDDVPEHAREQLRAQGWILREVEPIPNPHPSSRHMMERFANVYTKLRAWELVEWDRVVFLDADTLVLANIDDLFERPDFAAAPDFFLPDRFNSGVMSLRPSRETFDAMLATLADATSYDGGDQGFLNTFFDWWNMPVDNRLGVGFNMPNFIYQFMMGHPVARQGVEHEVKILHYLVQKPWLSKATLTGGAGPWWRRYYEVHPESARPLANAVHDAEDWSFDRLCKLVVG
ncbi:MAG: glycosyltransferase family 8 protein [Polyangiales bacterium]